MMRTLRIGTAPVFMLALATCGGDGPTGNAGIVQLYDIRVSPQTVTCGFTINPPLRNISSPDTVLVQVHVINTTKDTLSMVTTGVYGQVIRASDSTQVSRVVVNTASLPYSPNPGVVGPKDGDLITRISLPMDPVCQTQPPFYLGTADVNISARVTMTSGQYVSDFFTVHVEWR
jgi:hypothetical protein